MAGQSYVFYAMAIAAAGTPDSYLTLTFEDAKASTLVTILGPLVTLGTAAWQLLQVSGICPVGATAARATVSALLTATGSGNAVQWTRIGVEPGTVAPTCWQPGPGPDTFPLVESSDDGGVTWTEVRGCESVNFDVSTWQGTVHDYEAPSNAARQYRASTAGVDYGIDPTGFYTVSNPSASASATLTVTDFYLVDPYAPSRYLMEQEGEISITSDEPQAVFAPLGRSKEIITYDEPKGKHFTFTLGMLTGAELDTFEALRATGRILFLQTPYARSWYVKIGPTQTTTWLLSPAATGRYNVAITLIEVARPLV